MRKIVGFSGSLSTPSRTRALVEMATAQGAAHAGGVSEILDLSDLGAAFGTARGLGDLDPIARRAVGRLVAADAVVIGTPVYKGSYTGLFKHFFDLLEPDALKDKPVLLTATSGGHRHALVIEHQLRPLFGFFEAQTVGTGLYASSEDFTGGRPTAPALLQRLDDAAAQLAGAIAGRQRAAPRPVGLAV